MDAGRLVIPLALMAGLTLLLAGSAHAQVLELRLRDEATRAPAAGAIVRLLRDGVTVAQGLTGEVGRVTLRAPGPGTYDLRIDRIGFATEFAGAVALAAGDTLRQDFTIRFVPRALPTLVVRGETPCDTRGIAGEPAATLWDEIRKALTATVLTQRESDTPVHLRLFEREVGPDRRVVRQWVDASLLAGSPAFASLPPAELVEVGFVHQDADREVLRYAGPTAELLLSDEFVSTHCFLAVPGGDALVGLAFEPVPGRETADVRGTLWVEARTSELRYLAFSYTGLPAALAPWPDAGGRLDFRRLDTGEWIVSAWHIRMPRVESVEGPRGPVLHLAGYRDRGGRAEVTTLPFEPDLAVLAGRVYDSTANRGLAGAVVRVRGYDDSTVTDHAGRFRLVLSAAGDRVVEVRHPKLDVGPHGGRLVALLSLGDTTVVEFAVPPLAAFQRHYCGAPRGRSGLVGVARGRDGTPAERLSIQVAWRTTGGGIRVERTQSGPEGAWAACNLPPGQELSVSVHDQEGMLAVRVLRLERAEFRWLEP